MSIFSCPLAWLSWTLHNFDTFKPTVPCRSLRAKILFCFKSFHRSVLLFGIFRYHAMHVARINAVSFAVMQCMYQCVSIACYNTGTCNKLLLYSHISWNEAWCWIRLHRNRDTTAPLQAVMWAVDWVGCWLTGQKKSSIHATACECRSNISVAMQLNFIKPQSYNMTRYATIHNQPSRCC